MSTIDDYRDHRCSCGRVGLRLRGDDNTPYCPNCQSEGPFQTVGATERTSSEGISTHSEVVPAAEESSEEDPEPEPVGPDTLATPQEAARDRALMERGVVVANAGVAEVDCRATGGAGCLTDLPVGKEHPHLTELQSRIPIYQARHQLAEARVRYEQTNEGWQFILDARQEEADPWALVMKTEDFAKIHAFMMFGSEVK